MTPGQMQPPGCRVVAQVEEAEEDQAPEVEEEDLEVLAAREEASRGYRRHRRPLEEDRQQPACHHRNGGPGWGTRRRPRASRSALTS